MKTFKSINPFNLEIINEYALQSNTSLDRTLVAVDQAQTLWQQYSLSQRGDKWLAAAELLEERADELAQLMALEMGKPLAQGLGEIQKCASLCRYYSEHTAALIEDTLLQIELLETEGKKVSIQYQALGSIFAIMPWNYPFWQVFRCIIPNMMMGNAVVLKHAENVTGCALAIENLLLAAGFIENSFKTLVIDTEQAKRVIQHSGIRAISLTGSTQAGRSVAQSAGTEIKKCVLELGGNDAYCVLADADIELAVSKCVTSRFQNSGQTCIAAKRWIIASDIYDDFLAQCQQLMKQHVLGDPLDKATTMGPLARIDLRDTLRQQLDQAVKNGAHIAYQSDTAVMSADNAFFPVTLLEGIDPNSLTAQQELFGPLASVYKVTSEAEMLTLANHSQYGLGAAVFTQDDEKAQYFAEQLQAGCVAINDFVVSHPAIPFGGIKQSGYGRELAREGLLEFVNLKSIVR